MQVNSNISSMQYMNTISTTADTSATAAEGTTKTDGVTDVKQAAADSITTLRNLSVEVSNADGTAREIAVPDLDDAEAVADFMADLEKLMAELTLENEESQLKATKERIESQLDELETKHKETLSKLDEAMKLSQEQADKAEKNRILGWIMTALSVVATALTIVLTCGAATPLAVAGCVCACASLAVNLTQQILTETGAMDDMVDAKAEKIRAENPQMSKAEAKAEASGQISMAFMITSAVLGLASLGCGIASIATSAGSAAANAAKIAGEVAENTSKLANQTFQLVGKLVNMIIGAVNTGLSIASTVNNWELLFLQKQSAEEEAQIAELQALLEKIQAAIDEEEEAMQALLDQIQSTLDALSQLLAAPSESAEEIMENLNMSI